jgi:hypothetical protein
MVNHAWMIGFVVSVTLILVATTALRLYTRIAILKKSGWEDCKYTDLLLRLGY